MIAKNCVVLLEEGPYEGKGGIVARQASIPPERHRPRLPKWSWLAAGSRSRWRRAWRLRWKSETVQKGQKEWGEDI